ncbi:MAG: hypothetical protein JNM19_11120 [Chitinophagaceae bacterium]|nr:hypothetical protein [Chitinophagaceae bacterium]
MADFKQKWYVLYTRPRFEAKVAKELTNSGVICLMPKTSVVKEYRSQRRLVQLPLFPSYVFVSPGSLSDYYFGLDLKGVLGYVKFGNEIATVSSQVISNLQILEKRKCAVELTGEKIATGVMVLICEGPFTGLKCEMVQFKGGRKALVRVNLLNTNLLLDIDIQKLKVMPSELSSAAIDC